MSIVCAVLVVLMHIWPEAKIGSLTWCIHRSLNDGFGRVAVPYFFVVSGFFLAKHVEETGWWRRAVGNRIRTLLIPYLIWNLLWMLFPLAHTILKNPAALQQLLSHSHFPALRAINPLVLPPLYPTWYIRALLLFVILSPLFVILLKQYPRTTIIVFVLLYAGFYRSEGIPFGTLKAFPNTVFPLEGCVYFLFGMNVSINGGRWNIPRRLAAAALFVSAVVTLFRIYCHADGKLPLYNHTRFLVVPGFLWMLWNSIPSTLWPKWITSTAFAIYLIHPFVVFCFRKLTRAPIESFAQYCACASLAILVPVVVKSLMYLLSKTVSRVVFGGR